MKIKMRKRMQNFQKRKKRNKRKSYPEKYGHKGAKWKKSAMELEEAEKALDKVKDLLHVQLQRIILNIYKRKRKLVLLMST